MNFTIRIPVYVSSAESGGGEVAVEQKLCLTVPDAADHEDAVRKLASSLQGSLNAGALRGEDEPPAEPKASLHEPFPTLQDAEDLEQFNSALVQVTVRLKTAKKLCTQLRARFSEARALAVTPSLDAVQTFLIETDLALTNELKVIDTLCVRGFPLAAVASHEAVHGAKKP